MRIALCFDVVVGRIAPDVVEVVLAGQRISPFRPFRRRQRQILVEHRVQHIDERHVGDDAEKEIRRHVGDRAHQHAARRAAVGDDASALGEALCNEIFASRDEVGEGVFLLLHLAVGVPAEAFVLAAADVRDRVDEAAVDER